MAQRIVALFLVSRQLLSMQVGTPCVETHLVSRRSVAAGPQAQSRKPPNDVEGAVRINTKSKLTFADARRFQDLCVDLFPGVTVKDIEYAELEIHIREAMKDETEGH